MRPEIKRIAYGVADFEGIQSRNNYYVDKTRFIPLLEESRYSFFIRPRRFGKSLWISTLETYYDQTKKDRFDQFFKNTWIGKNPTEEQGSYMVLTLNFSAVRGDPDKVERSFEDYADTKLHRFLERYSAMFPGDSKAWIQSKRGIPAQLSALFQIAAEYSLKIYILIDEYDNFANTILSTAGEKAYHNLTHGDGFYRHFFAVLKEGTSMSSSGLQRLFITGVSPVTMDDVTSGFNIGDNLSLEPKFNEFVGFTRSEVQEMLEYYQKEGVFTQEIDGTLDLMTLWYDNYRFDPKSLESMFNTDMVIYFVNRSIQNGEAPDELIDQNIRIDYGKLKHLMLVSRKLNGNFNRLKQIVEDGEVSSTITKSFPLEQLTQPENFISLLYYFGLLSIDGNRMGETLLKIPNRTVWKLMYGYIREAWRDTGVFRIDFFELAKLVREMAWLGKWENFFDFIADALQNQTKIRDYLSAEKVVQGFLLAYLNISDFYISRTEHELKKGFADIFLEPFLAKYPDLPCAYLIELKYIKRGEFTDALLEEKVLEAQTQLKQYMQDDTIQKQYAAQQTIPLVAIFKGWELVYRETL